LFPLFFCYLKSLYDMGARKFAVMGTLPLGCLPGARALTRACELFVNQGAAMFNQQLSADIDNLGATFPGAKFVYVDMYNPLLGLIINPQASGNNMIHNSRRILMCIYIRYIYNYIFQKCRVH